MDDPVITLVSVNVGLPKMGKHDGGKPFLSGIFKEPVDGPTFLDHTHLEGDGSADLVHHRGLDKALCVYCHEHFPYWEKHFKREFPPGFFGENLTLQGLPETEIHIGDVFRIGEVEVQCSQPRQPCHKLNKKFNDKTMVSQVQELGFTGYYLRVLQQGWLKAGARLERVHADSARLTIDECNRVMFHDKDNLEALRRVLDHPLLAESWKQSLYPRREKLESRTPNFHPNKA
jgi:MOSC domain-containing protein YiiM